MGACSGPEGAQLLHALNLIKEVKNEQLPTTSSSASPVRITFIISLLLIIAAHGRNIPFLAVTPLAP